jgi:glutathione S-transferase
VTLVESDAIAQYVAESGPQATNLLGVDTATRAKIRQWITFTECEVYGNMLGVVLPRAGYVPYDSEKETSSASGLAWALGVVEKHLSHGNRDWLATSDRLSLADLTLASALYWAFMHYLDEERRKKFPVTTAWYLHTIGIEGVQEVFGPPNLVSVAKEFA